MKKTRSLAWPSGEATHPSTIPFRAEGSAVTVASSAGVGGTPVRRFFTFAR